MSRRDGSRMTGSKGLLCHCSTGPVGTCRTGCTVYRSAKTMSNRVMKAVSSNVADAVMKVYRAR